MRPGNLKPLRTSPLPKLCADWLRRAGPARNWNSRRGCALTEPTVRFAFRAVQVTLLPRHALKPEQYECVIPGEVAAPAFGCRIRIDVADRAVLADSPNGAGRKAVMRSWKPGDRVHLRYSSGLRKVKEVLERMKVTGEDRTHWPVLEVVSEVAGEGSGRIVWMRGVELEPDPGLRVCVEPLAPGSG